jgi:Lrp/AsnC family transcriptional regulator, leucine-responsive regulatory protein
MTLQVLALIEALAPECCKNLQMSDVTELDAVDWRILAALQKTGRATYDELAVGVGLSASATLRRVKRLEGAGVITGYAAQVAAAQVGLKLTAYLNVRLSKHGETARRSPMDTFAAAVQTWPEVVECVALTGEMDYLLKVLVRDMAHYSHFLMDSLLKHPAVQDCKTSFQLRSLKATSGVPML